jgi:hypothetical protein
MGYYPRVLIHHQCVSDITCALCHFSLLDRFEFARLLKGLMEDANRDPP